MSIANLLLAFAPALAARLNPFPELEAENERLKAEVEGVRIALAVVKRSVERLRAERDQYRALADLYERAAWLTARNDLAQRGLALEQQAQAQYALQQAQNAQAQVWPYCDCSPSRAAALATHGSDGHAGAGEDAPL
jgi:hypothetical protein